jgi:hypothetical protein
VRCAFQPYGCDTQSNAAVSQLILSKAAFLSAIRNIITTGSTQGVNFVTSIGLAYNSYRTKDGTLVNNFGGNAFKWFCSGKVHKPEAFGPGTGFVDQLYIFGEEAAASGGWGRFFALHQNTLNMISGAGSGDATQLQGGINGLPPDALENMAMIQTGETGHVALLCSPDYGTQALKLYVGKKGERRFHLLWTEIVIKGLFKLAHDCGSKMSELKCTVLHHMITSILGFRTNGQSCGNCTSDADILARNGLGEYRETKQTSSVMEFEESNICSFSANLSRCSLVQHSVAPSSYKANFPVEEERIRDPSVPIAIQPSLLPSLKILPRLH